MRGSPEADLAVKSKFERLRNSSSIPLGERVLRYSLILMSYSVFKVSESSFLRVRVSGLSSDLFYYSVSLVFLEKNYSFKRSGVSSFSISIFSISKRKKGALGSSFLGKVGLFLSLIYSRLNMACHLL